MPDKEMKKDSDRKIRKMAKDIVNELLKSGDPVRIDISTGGVVQKCGAVFNCGESTYECKSKFDCTGVRFECYFKFIDSPDYRFTV